MAVALAEPGQVRPEEAHLIAARDDLALYGKLVHGHTPAKHHWWWIRRLEKVEQGEIKRILMVAPPGSAKSTWVRTFIEWHLGRHPDHAIQYYTSSGTNALLFGNPVRNTLTESPEHAAIFPEPECRPDQKRGQSVIDGMFLTAMAKDSSNPSFRSIGYTGSSIGTRAHGIVLDDPLDQDAQESDTLVAQAIGRFEGTVDNRLFPGGWIIAIMTSFRESDFTHWLAARGWHVVHMPAVGDPAVKAIHSSAQIYPLAEGEHIWPEHWSKQFFFGDPEAKPGSDEHRGKIVALGKAKFNAVWQGDPTAMGGLVFKERNWFRELPKDFDKRDGNDGRTPRERLAIIQAWDFNFSVLDTANYTVGLTLGVDDFKNQYILAVRRGHYSPTTDVTDKNSLAAVMIDEIEWRQPHLVAISDAAFRQKICRDVWEIVRRHVSAPVLKPKMAQGDKESMALIPAGRAEGGQVFVDMEAPWAEDFIVECLAFPKGVFDDQVDAWSLAASTAAERRVYSDEELEPVKYSFRR